VARRFEIPRHVLNDIKDLGTEAEKIKALDSALEGMGITNELLAAQTRTTAVEFDKLSGAWKDSQAAIGQLVAQGIIPGVQALTSLFTVVSQNIGFLANFKDKIQSVQVGIFATSTSLDQINQKVQTTNAAIYAANNNYVRWAVNAFGVANGLSAIVNILAPMQQQLSAVTPLENQFVQTLVSAKVPLEEAVAILNKFSDTLDRAKAAGEADVKLFKIEDPAILERYNNAIVTLAASGDAGRAGVEGLSSALEKNQTNIYAATISANQMATAIISKAQADLTAKDSTDQVTQATTLLTQELLNNATEAIHAQAQSEALKYTQEQLYNAALAAAQGFGNSEVAAQAMAAKFGIAKDEALKLIGVLQALAALQGGIARQNKFLRMDQDNASTTDPAELLRQQREANQAIMDANAAAYRAQKAAQEAYKESNKKSKAGGGGTSPKLSAQEKTNNKLLTEQDKFNDKFEDAEIKHMEKLADIYEEYYKKFAEQQQKNEIDKRRSKVGFYDSLNEDAQGIDVAKFAAQYEEAFQKAQEIAQSGSASLANEFLAMRQAQIEELKALESEAAKIQGDEELSEDQKRSALEYLEGRRRLIEDAQKEELDQLLKAGDEINNELANRLSEEEELYRENTDKIALQADRKADAIISAAERARIKIVEENRLLAEQLKLTKSITDTANRTAPTPTGSTTPLPEGVTSDIGILVRQEEIWRVIDQDSVNAIRDVGVRLENKLSEVVSSIESANRSITGAISRTRTSDSVVR
jgi:hypothetical protein